MNHWPTEIIFCGFEIGYNIITGRRVSRMPVENHPIKDVFFTKHVAGRTTR